MRMNRTLNQLRWILVSYVTQKSFAWNTLIWIILISLPVFFTNTLKHQSEDPDSAIVAASQFFMSTLLWFPVVDWAQIVSVLKSQRNNSVACIMPHFTSRHSAFAIGWLVLISTIFSLISSATSLSFFITFPIVLGLMMLNICTTLTTSFSAIPSWIRTSNFSLPMIWPMFYLIMIFCAPDYLEMIFLGRHQIMTVSMWVACLFLLTLFITLFSIKREFTPMLTAESDSWFTAQSKAGPVVTEASPWASWMNGFFDRRLEGNLNGNEFLDTPSKIRRWQLANQGGWFTLLFVGIVFLVISIVMLGIARVPKDLALPIIFSLAFGIYIIPLGVAKEWRKRRRTMELEVLRPVKPVDFQLQIAAAFLLDLLPMVVMGSTGLLGLWFFSESENDRWSILRFALLCSPTILLCLTAFAAAFTLLDEPHHRLSLGASLFAGAALTYIAFSAVAIAPWLVFGISAVIAIVAILCLMKLYEYWEDMELGRESQEGLQDN